MYGVMGGFILRLEGGFGDGDGGESGGRDSAARGEVSKRRWSIWPNNAGQFPRAEAPTGHGDCTPELYMDKVCIAVGEEVSGRRGRRYFKGGFGLGGFGLGGFGLGGFNIGGFGLLVVSEMTAGNTAGCALMRVPLMSRTAPARNQQSKLTCS
jgi:hypothetical protein